MSKGRAGLGSDSDSRTHKIGKQAQTIHRSQPLIKSRSTAKITAPGTRTHNEEALRWRLYQKCADAPPEHSIVFHAPLYCVGNSAARGLTFPKIPNQGLPLQRNRSRMEASRRGESAAVTTRDGSPCRHQSVSSTFRRALAGTVGLRSSEEPDTVVALRLILGDTEAVYQ